MIGSKPRRIQEIVGAVLLLMLVQNGSAAPGIERQQTESAAVPAIPFTSSAVTTGTLSPTLMNTRIKSVPLDPEDTALFHIPLTGVLSDIGFRTATADGGQFDRLYQYALFLDFDLPRSWSPWPNVTADPRLTFEVGRFEFGDEHRTYASLGPALRLTNDRWRIPVFADFGLAPTVIDGSQYEGDDFGTSLNFTSHAALGIRFGHRRAHTVSLRYQHISNGGINSTNPGTNMIGLDFTFWAKKH